MFQYFKCLYDGTFQIQDLHYLREPSQTKCKPSARVVTIIQPAWNLNYTCIIYGSSLPLGIVKYLVFVDNSSCIFSVPVHISVYFLYFS